MFAAKDSVRGTMMEDTLAVLVMYHRVGGLVRGRKSSLDVCRRQLSAFVKECSFAFSVFLRLHLSYSFSI